MMMINVIVVVVIVVAVIVIEIWNAGQIDGPGIWITEGRLYFLSLCEGYFTMNCPFLVVVQLGDRMFWMLGTWELWEQGVFSIIWSTCLTSTRAHLKIKKYSKHSSLAAHLSPSQEVLHTPIVRYGLCSMAALTTAPSSAFAKVLVPCFQQVKAHANTACTSEKRYWHTYFLTPLHMLYLKCWDVGFLFSHVTCKISFKHIFLWIYQNYRHSELYQEMGHS